MARRGSIAFLAAALLPRHRRSGERLIKTRANENRRSPLSNESSVFHSNDFRSLLDAPRDSLTSSRFDPRDEIVRFSNKRRELDQIIGARFDSIIFSRENG